MIWEPLYAPNIEVSFLGEAPAWVEMIFSNEFEALGYSPTSNLISSNSKPDAPLFCTPSFFFANSFKNTMVFCVYSSPIFPELISLR